MTRRHVIIVTFPAQGHINPALHFTRKLLDLSIDVTFTTSVSALKRMSKPSPVPEGLSFASFSDGYDDGFKDADVDADRFMSEVRTQGSETLRNLILDSSTGRRRRPVACVAYTIMLPWVSAVSRELHVPSVLLWIQPASVMGIYRYYFDGGHEEEFAGCSENPDRKIRVPGIPFSLSKQDLPSFLVPSSSEKPYGFIVPTLKEQLDTLDNWKDDEKPKILVNTFDALETHALKAFDDRYDVIGVGPMLPLAFLGDPSEKPTSSLGGDLFEKSSDDYIEWLSAKPASSVVYVSFGSILTHSRPQMEEIAKGLLQSNRPFLWVIREQTKEEEPPQVSCVEELERLGRIVPWCSQVDVLRHESVGCFVSHCGWNSTLESLACGVPVVAFPHWTDQGTNAKLVEELWRTGVRVRAGGGSGGGGGGEGVVEGGEISRCVEEVMGRGEFRENAATWRDLAREAVVEGGSSTRNLRAFLECVGGDDN